MMFYLKDRGRIQPVANRMAFQDAVKGWCLARSKQGNTCVFTVLQQEHAVCSAAQTLIINKSMSWDELAILLKTGDFGTALQTFFSHQQIPSGEGHSDVNPYFLVWHWMTRRPPNAIWVIDQCAAANVELSKPGNRAATWWSVLIYTTMTSHHSNKNNMSQIFLWLGIMSWSHWGFCSHKGWF